MIVTIRDDRLTAEDVPEVPGDLDGKLALLFALLWAMQRILETTTDQLQRETMH